jgi:uncharacterized protein (DUF2252 family)
MGVKQAVESARPKLAERFAQGKELRRRVPRSAHARWEPAKDRPDPVTMLEESSKGRVPELIPIRYGRMASSPFAFLRGAAGGMAFDLSATPTTGVQVQACGDCHLMNFGGFGTPERHFIFDVTDFDETLPAPWEWDVKRLAASVLMAARSINLSKRDGEDAVRACVRSYRRRVAEYAAMHALDVWYARLDGRALLDLMGDVQSRRRRKQALAKIHHNTTEHIIPKLTEVVDGKRRFHDHPPLLFHLPHGHDFHQQVRRFLGRYLETLQEDRRTLVSRYQVVDTAMKVVGVGSVGTRCAILLMMAGDDDALVLQYKEAGPSVLEPFAGKSKHKNHAQRVVCGQRLLQSSSDMFLGWTTDEEGRDFYFRQLRDMKTTVTIADMTADDLTRYVELCGWTLARGHAKSGDAAVIAGYLGSGDAFDEALAEFARTYADQTERDHEALVKAIQEGRLVAQTEEPQVDGVAAATAAPPTPAAEAPAPAPVNRRKGPRRDS